MKPHWTIFCDTNPNSGKGHVSRMLTLSEKLKKEIKVSFITQSLDHVYCNEIKKAGHDICELNDIKKNKIYICIIDGNSFKNREIDLIKNMAKFTIQVYDYKIKNYETDYVISYDYNFKNSRVIGRGLKYSLINSKFANKKIIKRRPENLLINFGLADKHNFTYKVLRNIGLYKSLKFKKIYISCQDIDNKRRILGNLVRKTKTTFIIREFKNDFYKVIKNSDIIIGAGGINLLERLCSGIPSITICTSDSQKHMIEYIKRKKATQYCGNFKNFSNFKFEKIMTNIFFNYNLRNELSKNGQKIVDANGSNRLVDKLLSL